MGVVAMWVGRVGEGKSHKSRVINQILTLAGAYLLLTRQAKSSQMASLAVTGWDEDSQTASIAVTGQD